MVEAVYVDAEVKRVLEHYKLDNDYSRLSSLICDLIVTHQKLQNRFSKERVSNANLRLGI